MDKLFLHFIISIVDFTLYFCVSVVCIDIYVFCMEKLHSEMKESINLIIIIIIK